MTRTSWQCLRHGPNTKRAVPDSARQKVNAEESANTSSRLSVPHQSLLFARRITGRLVATSKNPTRSNRQDSQGSAPTV
eukprot:6311946-Prymnesium_polylepis.1